MVSNVRYLAALFALFALAVTGCGGEGDAAAGPPGLEGSPEDAAEQLLRIISDRNWAREWDSLHPEQQKFVPREKFVDCGDDDAPRIESVKVVEVNDDPFVVVPGTDLTQPSKAVTVDMEVWRGRVHKQEVREVVYLFDVDGRWRWVLSSVEAYKSGGCPD